MDNNILTGPDIVPEARRSPGLMLHPIGHYHYHIKDVSVALNCLFSKSRLYKEYKHTLTANLNLFDT
jgi:hypothetical protein